MPAKDKSTTSKPAVAPGKLAKARAAFGDRGRVFAAISTALSSAIALACAACLIVGYRPLLAKASEMSKAPPRVEIAWPLIPLPANAPPGTLPMTWLDSESRIGLERLVSRQLGENPFDARAIAGVHDALMATGWFDEASGGASVVRGEDGIVRVDGAWRSPTAAVRVGDCDHLVARGGELLQPTYKKDGSGFRVILGAAYEKPEFGKPWLGGDVQEGLALLKFLSAMPGFQQVYGVDVSEFVNGNQLVVVTDQGNRIIWGGSSNRSEFSAGQATPEKKREELAKLFAMYGRIDAGRTVIDVRPEAGAYIHVTEVARSDKRR
jgi:hypothetical protein